MTERSRVVVRPDGRTFVPRSLVMNAEDLRRALTRIAHEVVERNHGADVVVVGLQTGGASFARHLAALIAEITGAEVPLGLLDVARHRDDVGLRSIRSTTTEMPVELTGRVVVMVDDVLFTGRTVRAALDALSEFGRARAVQLAVMVDRGHRELPIRPDFVGKNLPTRIDELVEVTEESVVIGELSEGGPEWKAPA